MTFSRTKALTFLLIAGLAACAESPAPPADDMTAEVAALFEHFNEGVQPGAAALVIKDGQVVFMQGFGYADIENKVREALGVTPMGAVVAAAVEVEEE